ILREIGSVIGRRRVGAQHRQASAEALLAQGFRRGTARRATADYHDGRVALHLARGPLRARWDRLTHHEQAVASLDSPAGYWIERGGADRFARPQAETRVMPWTAHRIADHQALAERAAVVRTGRADREVLIAATRHEHRLASDVASLHRAIREVRRRNSHRQVGSRRFRLFSHDTLRV